MTHRRRIPRSGGSERLRLPGDPVATSTGIVELVRDPSRPSAVTVYINDAESSYVDLDDPEHLEFEYMQQMAEILDVVTEAGGALRMVHLGGAGCALARALAHRRPGSRQLVVEIDAELARLAREWFALPRAPELRIRVADARQALDTLRPESWDVIVRDVFAGVTVPPHVRTLSAAQAAARALSPTGVYLVNLTDDQPLHQARAEVATLRGAFAHVLLVADPALLRGRRFGNVVLAASATPIDAALVDRRLRRLPHPARVLSGEHLARFAGDTPAIDDSGTIPGSSPVSAAPAG